METLISNDLIGISTRLMLATDRAEIIRAASDINATVEKLLEKQKNGSYLSYKPQSKSVSGTVKFTQKEISCSNMATTFKKEFIANGLSARIIKRESGKNSFCYEIRYRRNGYNIEVSSTDLAEAKLKFLEATSPQNIDKYYVKKISSKHHFLEEVFEEWYNFKSKTKVTKKVLQTHKTHFQKLPKYIQKKPIKAITMENVASCLNQLSERMYEEYRTLFNMVFTFAMANGYIFINPLSLIPFARAKRNNREALTENEIKSFLTNILSPQYDKIRQMAYFYYFFGLRASELDEETRREGDFLITRNRKRKNGKIEYKKIPIPKAAETLIDWTYPLHREVRKVTAGKLFHLLLGEDKSAYNLRHTFSTICQKKVRQEIVEIWIGDSPQRLIGKVYTHFDDEFMREQMDLVEFPTIICSPNCSPNT